MQCSFIRNSVMCNDVYKSPQVSVTGLEVEQAVLASSFGVKGDYTHRQMVWDVDSDNEFE